jgi:trans-aconitate methyltransferase
MTSQTNFDLHADTYDVELAQALSTTGEGKDYFAEKRALWLSHLLKQLGERPNFVLDFGCGIGSEVPLLRRILGAEKIIGVDVSHRSIELAKRRFESEHLQFATIDAFSPNGEADLAYCNGVFHHIAARERHSALNWISRSLRPAGLFAFWENNPWNPGTRYVMSNCAFDDDAITITPSEGSRLLATAGFSILRKDSLFFFPKALKWLRVFEPALRTIPLGGQYLVLCKKA